MILLANDPSIRGWGWVVIQIKNHKIKLLESGCIKTEPQHKKLKIRKGDDTARRLKEIADTLLEIDTNYSLDWIVSEAPHGSQSASAAMMVGAVTGVIATFSAALGLPVEYYTEGEAKYHLLKKRSASKKETLEAIKKIYGSKWSTGVDYKDEAIADALQVFHVARSSSEALKFAMNQ